MTAVCGSDGEWDPDPIHIDCNSYSSVPNGKYFNNLELLFSSQLLQFLWM